MLKKENLEEVMLFVIEREQGVCSQND